MLEKIDTDIWSVTHFFKVNGLPVSSRMTVVRLADNRLLLHSPVPVSALLKAKLDELGEVTWLIAPSKMHHLFLADCQRTFPAAKAYAAPGLKLKFPKISGIEELNVNTLNTWAPSLEGLLFEGIPAANETLWFHRPSATLIATDLLQWWRGDLPWGTRMWALLTGTRSGLVVPQHVRWLIKDHAAASRSAQHVLDWQFERIVVAHNTVVDNDAYALTKKALAVLMK